MEALLAQIDFAKGGGLVTAVAQDAETGEVLMVAFMNELALRRTLETGEVHYWSRSRQELWHKGQQSGRVQRLEALYVDCDGDAILVRIRQVGGAACHTGHRSCFHRRAEGGALQVEGTPLFDPEEVYRR